MKNIVVNDKGHLVFTLDDDTVIDAGYVMGSTGPRGHKGSVGMPGAPGFDSCYGETGPAGPTGSSLVCVQTSPGGKYFTLVMSDKKHINVPMTVVQSNCSCTCSTGPAGVGIQGIEYEHPFLKVTLTDSTVESVELESQIRTLASQRKGTMPVYYDSISKTFYAVNEGIK